MKKITEISCMVAYEPPLQPGMTKARDWDMEANKPRIKTEERQIGNQVSDKTLKDGVTFRQPL